ncbi:hypothetical protein NXW64_15540 [Bacteroides ovatus]|nr:hypothetical protein NXW64_15540 [Bacteroides ovatus]
MKQIILNLVIGSLSFIGTSCSAEFENGVSDIDSWEPVSYEFTIKHPCLVHTQADFDYVKSKVDQQASTPGLTDGINCWKAMGQS